MSFIRLNTTAWSLCQMCTSSGKPKVLVKRKKKKKKKSGMFFEKDGVIASSNVRLLVYEANVSSMSQVLSGFFAMQSEGTCCRTVRSIIYFISRIKETSGNTVLSTTKEQAILKSTEKCRLGLSSNATRFKNTREKLLDNTGRIIHRFKDNLPAPGWISSFWEDTEMTQGELPTLLLNGVK
ncbi:hypothetical protein FQR65_LT03051 [Abscondita terminalis]|nr:hypothetical protein FQR65_LT03051 [Abscondita terminalis]